MPLDTSQMSLLSKELLYCPASRTDWFNLELDVLNFFCRVTLSAWYSNVDKPLLNFNTEVKPCDFCLKQFDQYLPSEFTPPSVQHPVETYMYLIQGEIEKLRNTNINHCDNPIWPQMRLRL